MKKDGSLADEIAIKKALNKLIPVHDINSWALQLLNGIDYLHEMKIIHRDIKPSYFKLLFKIYLSNLNFTFNN
jgi:serine/threonine protein kinase